MSKTQTKPQQIRPTDVVEFWEILTFEQKKEMLVDHYLRLELSFREYKKLPVYIKQLLSWYWKEWYEEVLKNIKRKAI